MFRQFVQFAARAFAVTAISTTSLAQAPAHGAPSMQAALEAAWEKSARRPAADGRLGVARANRTAADALWAAPPALELAHRGDPLLSASGKRETEIGIAWPLLLPGQRFARGESADAELKIAEATQKAALLLVAWEVREAAWAVYAVGADIGIAEAQARTLESLAADVQRRVDAGDLARADALAARAELLAAQANVSTGNQRLEGAMARWTLLTGLRLVPGSHEAPTASAIEDHPELILERFKTEGARKRLELARLNRRSPPEIIVRYRHELPASNLGTQDSVGVALRLPFATQDRNLPLEAAAIAEANLAIAEERRMRERLDSEFAVARNAESASQRQVTLEEARHALLSERARLVEKSFRAGETALPELIRTLAAAAQAERNLARQRADLGLARARVQQAAGKLP